ncbi:class I SAM-dependent methyltransferase [Chondromyces apiculatus]|uniref:SAM-dependent methyltransferase n=1 Tax=Chondromyces apiculatus DSM 436 TaxID=1192034 RepID=A0A017TI03_9BACT|nr:50S ribosomal protein L11 methyltransferase [Chondromyces apiculatus]EYF08465.1 SAM-dependent methyltransferase [Chondromyces apiculatus DSM 436]
MRGEEVGIRARAAAFIVEQTAVTAPPLVPEVRLHLATEVTPLWRITEEEMRRLGLWGDAGGREIDPSSSGVVPPPYWAFVWAGGHALARHVLDHPALVAGRRVLDFASGSGIGALAAAKAGAAAVTAADVDPFAVVAIALNARLNGEEITVRADDLTATPAALAKPAARTTGAASTPSESATPDDWDVILAGDVCYDREMAACVLPWLRARADAGAVVLLGDPGRAYCPADGYEVLAHCKVPTSLDLEGREALDVRILRLR